MNLKTLWPVSVLVALILTTCSQPMPAGRPEDPDSFTVTVMNGYGSGEYAPGSTVHIWSGASTANEVVLPWSGDSELLTEPTQWVSTFVMPARDVHLTAETEPFELTLTVEQFTGATNVPKTMRYHFPPAMRGVVLMSHGTGGSSSFIERTEAFALAVGLVHAGYGVISTEAEEAAAGDLNGDGKIRWQGGYSEQNVDLRNVEELLAGFQARELIPEGIPRFALGMSAGGSFSHRLGSVSSTDAAAAFPHLVFNGVISYCADATSTQSGSRSTTPSAWYMCGAEDNAEVSNAQALANHTAMAARGIPTDYHEHRPTPLHDERFTRVEGVSAETSAAMAFELEAAGFVGADGFLTNSGTEIASAIGAEPTSFPIIAAQTGSRGALRSQLQAVRAEHTMYADATARTIAFFDQFVSPASVPFDS